MLAACLEVPSDKTAWDVWAWHSKGQIDAIQDAIQKKYGITLVKRVLYPWTPTEAWLINNSQSHGDFNSVLGLQGHDLDAVNFENRDEVAAWINLCYNELYDASAALGV